MERIATKNMLYIIIFLALFSILVFSLIRIDKVIEKQKIAKEICLSLMILPPNSTIKMGGIVNISNNEIKVKFNEKDIAYETNCHLNAEVFIVGKEKKIMSILMKK